MPFQPGHSGNPHGRPKGSRNKSSLAVREWATGIVEDPKVQARLLVDARTGKLHPSLMTALMAYAYGKPHDTMTAEPMIPLSEIEDARQSLEVKLRRIRESLESR
jgi:hypothetical protein